MRAFSLGVGLGAGLVIAPAAARAEPPQGGRAEALIFATTFGFYQGIAATWLLADYDVLDSGDLLTFAATLTLASTGGSYALASYVTKKYGVNEAQASMFNSSLFWGVLNGAGGGLALDTDATGMLWSTLGTGWAGQATGILLAANVDRTAGQVGLMNTIGTWTGAEVMLIMAAAGAEEGFSLWGTLAVDAGLLAGVFLSSQDAYGRGISQERTRLLDLGALAGGLAGPAALFMVWGPEDNIRAWYLSAVAVGIPVGIGTAWYLTRNYDRDATAEDAKAADASTLMVPLAAGVF